MQVDRQQALAFRLDGHHLSRRLPPGSYSRAAGACGVQNTPPGAAALSLHARVENCRPDEVERSLLQTWSLRGAPHLFPTAEAPVFTLGLLPEGEEELRGSIFGIQQGLAIAGMTATEVVERTGEALHAVLDGRVLSNKRRLDQDVAARVARGLPPERLAAWAAPSPYAAGQRLGEALVSFALRPLALRGQICFAPRTGSTASFVRPDQWLGAPWPAADPQAAAAELVRRYLRCYGPSTPEGLSGWAGISTGQAERIWRLITGEVIPVNLERRPAWVLAADLPRLADPAPARGVRFLPPHDPYLQMRDRATLVADRAVQRRLWRAAGSPGAVLADGELVATWRAEKHGKRLCLTVESFAASLPDLEAEAQALLPFRGCTELDLNVNGAGS